MICNHQIQHIKILPLEPHAPCNPVTPCYPVTSCNPVPPCNPVTPLWRYSVNIIVLKLANHGTYQRKQSLGAWETGWVFGASNRKDVKGQAARIKWTKPWYYHVVIMLDCSALSLAVANVCILPRLLLHKSIGPLEKRNPKCDQRWKLKNDFFEVLISSLL